MDEKTNRESEIIQKNKRKTPEIIGLALVQIKNWKKNEVELLKIKKKTQIITFKKSKQNNCVW